MNAGKLSVCSFSRLPVILALSGIVVSGGAHGALWRVLPGSPADSRGGMPRRLLPGCHPANTLGQEPAEFRRGEVDTVGEF